MSLGQFWQAESTRWTFHEQAGRQQQKGNCAGREYVVMQNGTAYLHSRNGPGFASKDNEPLCNTLRTAVEVSLGADQVVAETAQKGA